MTILNLAAGAHRSCTMQINFTFIAMYDLMRLHIMLLYILNVVPLLKRISLLTLIASSKWPLFLHFVTQWLHIWNWFCHWQTLAKVV